MSSNSQLDVGAQIYEGFTIFGGGGGQSFWKRLREGIGAGAMVGDVRV